MSENQSQKPIEVALDTESDAAKDRDTDKLVGDTNLSANDQETFDTGQYEATDVSQSSAAVGNLDESGRDIVYHGEILKHRNYVQVNPNQMGDSNETHNFVTSTPDVTNKSDNDTHSDVTVAKGDDRDRDGDINLRSERSQECELPEERSVLVPQESLDSPRYELIEGKSTLVEHEKSLHNNIDIGMSNSKEETCQPLSNNAISDSKEFPNAVNECSLQGGVPKVIESTVNDTESDTSQTNSHSSVKAHTSVQNADSSSHSHSVNSSDDSHTQFSPHKNSENNSQSNRNVASSELCINENKSSIDSSPSHSIKSDTEIADTCVSKLSENDSNCDKTENTESIQSTVSVHDSSKTSCSNDQFEDDSDDLLSQLESELRTEVRSLETSQQVSGGTETASESTDKELESHELESTETSALHVSNYVNTKNTPINSEQVSASLDSTANVSNVSPLEQSTGQGDLVPNGDLSQSLNTLPEYKELQSKHDTLQKLYADKDIVIKRLRGEKELISKSLQNALREKDCMNERVKELAEKSSSGEKTFIVTIKELENTIAQQKQEVEASKEKLTSHDLAAKRAIQQLQTELQAKLAHVTRAYEECKREKEGMVVKYAMAEQKNIDMENRMQKNNKRCVEMERETNLAVNKFKAIRAEKAKIEEAFQHRNSEIMALRRELEKFKELKAEQELKTKWHQNKLRTELEAHKETKGKFDEANKKLKQARDEAENMKRDCQAMIKQYQETEVQKSSSLSAKINEKEAEVRQRKQEVTEQQEVHSLVKNQLDTLKRNHKDMIEELRTAKDKITCLEAERIHQEDTLSKFKETLQQQKQDNKELYDKLAELEGIDHQLSIEKEKVASMQRRVDELEELNSDLRTDIESCANRESGHLDITKRLSDANAKLQSENSALQSKVESLQGEHDELQSKYHTLTQSSDTLSKELTSEKERRIEEVGSLTMKLEERSKGVDELTQQLDDQRDENKTLKRRHTSNIKDLHRQLQQAHRKLEKGSLNGEVSSMGSRTSSNNSLNTLVNSEPQLVSAAPIQEEAPLPQEPEPPLVQFVEVDKQVLVEKIVKLQKSLARRNEKLEFQEEHINQLINELQKKAKVIQSYVVREEAGALAPESSDLNKVQLSRKGGIMASVYNHQARDDHMTMDLSLQINHKLQAVLEDTLLKNITLKESMDTLGREISDLSQQNRELQLSMQKSGRKS